MTIDGAALSRPGLLQAVDPADPEVRAFLEWLRESSEGAVVIAIDRGDGKWASVDRLMFHDTLKTGLIGHRFLYGDRWCYDTLAGALVALVDWFERHFEGEPVGWRRHPLSGRRRNDAGDPESEWIAV